MEVNSKFDFWRVWKFCWDLSNVVSGGDWLFRWTVFFSGGTLYPFAKYERCCQKSIFKSWGFRKKIKREYGHIGGILSVMGDSNLLHTMSMGWEKREGTFAPIHWKIFSKSFTNCNGKIIFQFDRFICLSWQEVVLQM